jgi:UDP-N-acetylmuramate-alanine ligase
MEYIGQLNNKAVYSDYSHHAPAIAGNMQALKTQFPDKKITVIFQPHQAQRVLTGRDDFTDALQGADELIIYKLYTAREDFNALQQEFPRLQSMANFDELGKQFARELNAQYITQINDIQDRLQKL